MHHEKLRPYLKWGCYYFLLLIFYMLQTTPGLFSLFGVKPVLILALATCVCMFEDIMPSAVFAMITGLLWDVSSDKLLGFNGVIVMVCGVMISLLCIYYLHAKLLNTILFFGILLLIQGFLDFFLYYAIWGYPNVYLVLWTNILPTGVYSLVYIIPTYFLIRRISDYFNSITNLKNKT